jgi:hypothetical protein
MSWSAYAASHSPGSPSPGSAGSVRASVLHLNDLYELLPSGRFGGVARLKTLLRNLQALSPNATLSVLAGDLLAPSALSTVPIAARGGDSFDGAQMVGAMNAIGLDWATLGNHEGPGRASERAHTHERCSSQSQEAGEMRLLTRGSLSLALSSLSPNLLLSQSMSPPPHSPLACPSPTFPGCA